MSTIKNETRNFDPGDRRYRGKLWIRRKFREGWLYHFYWSRIGIALGVLALIAWLGLAGGFWAIAKYRRGFSEAQYIDLAAPWRWGHYRRALSAHYVETGTVMLRRLGAGPSLPAFEAALSLWPENLIARQLEAAAQRRLGRDSAALATMRDGLNMAAKAADQKYAENFFTLAFQLQADDEALTMGRRLLPSVPDERAFNQLVALNVATALFNLGKYADAENLIGEWHMQNFYSGQILLARCEWESGMRRPAIRRLEVSLQRFKQRSEIYITLESFSRQMGLKEDVQRYAQLRQFDDPADPAPQIDLIAANHALGLKSEEKGEIDAYCADFKRDPNALIRLAQFSVDTGQPDVAERVRGLAQAGGRIDLGMFDMGVMQASLTGRDYRRTLRTIAKVKTDVRPGNKVWDTSLAAMRTVALFGLGDSGAGLTFSDLLPLAGHLPPNSGVFLARQFGVAGAEKQGRQLLESVCAAYPNDEGALTELVRMQAKDGDRVALRASLPRLLKMRKPSRDALEAAMTAIDVRRDAALWAQIVACLRAGPAAVQAR